ncbi:hypothetical protein BMS3Abin07_02213 [bacterium BMS3Abin07]|nr:hypothetical protein BMS3Abin07_02213 [bacterium BMS3Abin07]
MKKGGKLLLIALLFLSIAVVMTNCGGGGGGGTTSGSGGGTTITSAQGQQAASASGQSAALANGSGETFMSLSGIGLSSVGGSPVPGLKFSKGIKKDAGLAITSELAGKFARSQAVQSAVSAVRKAVSEKATSSMNGTGTCTDGGDYSFTGTSDSVTGDFDLTFTFNNCRDGSGQYDGNYHLTGTSTGSSTNITMALSGLTIYEYDSSNTLVYSMTANITLGLSMTGSGSSISATLTAGGDITATDHLSGNTYTLTYTNFAATISFSSDSTAGTETFTATVNGVVNESWTASGTSYSVKVTFTNFNLQGVNYGTYDVTTLSGTVAIDFTPDAYCFEGTFTFVTNIPIRYEDSVGHNVAGQVTVNGNTVITWNAAGKVTVTVDGTQVYNGDEAGLYDTCGFVTMDPDSHTSSGGSGGTVSGASMTITLTWNGGDTSDMDLHVNYYNTTTPTATTPGTGYVDWHGMVDVGCPSTFSYACADLDGDSVADMGLDFDDMFGYGPEHIYATSLPAGYYVVSVNSFDFHFDPNASISVSIQIGSTTFGPYTHTFSVDDTESHVPGAWFAVADIVVDASGNATVQPHDSSLELWHDGAFGIAVPAAAKKLR